MTDIDWDETVQLFVATGPEYGIQSTFGRVVAEGTLADMVRKFAAFSEIERENHAIQSSTTAWPGSALIMGLYNRPDFPPV